MQSRADLFGLLCFFVIEFIYKKMRMSHIVTSSYIMMKVTIIE